MKKLLLVFLLIPLFIVCKPRDTEGQAEIVLSGNSNSSLYNSLQAQAQPIQSRPETYIGEEEFSQTLDRIAEVERSGAYFQGLGFFESAFRMDMGDYYGALIAAYKDLSWAYGHSEISKSDMEDGINQHALALMAYSDAEAGNVLAGILAFSNGSWNEAAGLLQSGVQFYEEIDSFSEWMLLVCRLESGRGDSLDRNKYGALRARYGLFPEYWYRGARTLRDEQAAIFAEHCINLNPNGPFAGESRIILAGFHGLETHAENMLTTLEIEAIVRLSVSESNPEILSSLFPMMEMPDNNYTHYVIGALRTLATLPSYRDYFILESSRNNGRLAERLLFISRG